MPIILVGFERERRSGCTIRGLHYSSFRTNEDPPMPRLLRRFGGGDKTAATTPPSTASRNASLSTTTRALELFHTLKRRPHRGRRDKGARPQTVRHPRRDRRRLPRSRQTYQGRKDLREPAALPAIVLRSRRQRQNRPRCNGSVPRQLVIIVGVGQIRAGVGARHGDGLFQLGGQTRQAA